MDVLFILRILAPLIPFNCFSIGRVTRFSISLGDVPAYNVDTYICGITMSGKFSLGREVKIFNPHNVTAIVATYATVVWSITQLVGLNFLSCSPILVLILILV